jgi:DNA modification methylase
MELPLNQIIQGDCLKILKTFPNKSVDLVLTDPPYGIGIAENPFRQKFTKRNWDNATPTREYFDEMRRVSKEQVIWGGNYFGLPPSQCFYVWDKVQPQDFSSSMCEMAWVSRQAPAKLFRQRVVSIQKFHPTTKPVELMEWVLGFFPEAQTVLDPFLGSGTTAVAAKMLGRKYIGIELSKEYCEIAQRRVASAPIPLFTDQQKAA